jgi:hypothetical protein
MYPVTEKQVQKWAGQYPAVDIRHELKAMRAYFYKAPKNLSTRRGINGFIAWWLGKHQNDGSRTYIGERKPPPRPETSYDLAEVDKLLDKVTF